MICNEYRRMHFHSVVFFVFLLILSSHRLKEDGCVTLPWWPLSLTRRREHQEEKTLLHFAWARSGGGSSPFIDLRRCGVESWPWRPPKCVSVLDMVQLRCVLNIGHCFYFARLLWCNTLVSDTCMCMCISS